MYSRSNHTDNGKLAKSEAKNSLKITSQVSESTHPSSNTTQHLIGGHQLMNTVEGVQVPSRDGEGTKESITLHMNKLVGT